MFEPDSIYMQTLSDIKYKISRSSILPSPMSYVLSKIADFDQNYQKQVKVLYLTQIYSTLVPIISGVPEKPHFNTQTGSRTDGLG